MSVMLHLTPWGIRIASHFEIMYKKGCVYDDLLYEQDLHTRCSGSPLNLTGDNQGWMIYNL